MEFNEEDLKRGKVLFSGTSFFIKSVVSEETLPNENFSEVAFLGRSNVGKSSLINALTNKKKLAKYSKTPGRTRQLNFFKLENKLGNLVLVDLPGYGFAKVSKQEQRDWKRLVINYLTNRRTLRTVLLLLDARREITIEDKKMIEFFNKFGLGWTCVITKVDKLKKNQITQKLDECRFFLKSKISAYPVLFSTSSQKKIGLNELRAYISTFVKN